MKTKDGYIRLINGKVKFEYYLLGKPEKENFKFGITTQILFRTIDWEKAMKEYEASKRTIEVSNVRKFLGEWVLTEKEVSAENLETLRIINNAPCKAEVTDKATIVELTKE